MRQSYYEWGEESYRYLGLDGKPVERTREQYPYNYDAYVTWKQGYKKGENNTVYSDRLFQWDSKKYNECCKKVWNNEGQYFNNRSPQEIEKFLSLYYGREIKLTVVMEGCNVSNGYPYWVFYYKEIGEK